MVAPKKDMDALYEQLADLQKQQQESHMKLREMSGSARRVGLNGPGRGLRRDSAMGGRGPFRGGRGPLPGPLERRSGRPSFGDLEERRGPPSGSRGRPELMDEDFDVPAPQRRLASAVVVDEDAMEAMEADVEEEEHGGGRWGEADDHNVPNSYHAEERRPRRSRALEGPDSADISGKKRNATNLEDKPDAKKRNRRMFGALLGTLNQFRKEDAQFRSSAVAAKREEALKRAEAKAQAKSKELRIKEKEQMVAARKAEVDRKKELILRGDRLHAEIMYHRRVEHRERISNFIFTKAEPALLWLPCKHSEATEKALADQEDGFQVWKDEEKAKMEAAQADIDAKLAELKEDKKKAEAEGQEEGKGAGNGGAAKQEAGKEGDGEVSNEKNDAKMEDGEVAGVDGNEEAADEEDDEMIDEDAGPEELADLLS